MTIGIETTKAYERKKTGVGWYTYYLIEALGKFKQDDVKFVLYVNPALLNPKSQIQMTKQIPNPNDQNPKHFVKKLAWHPRILWTQLRLSYEMATNPPDVLFIPAHLPPLIHPEKLVVTVHDLAFKQYPKVYSKKELRLQEWGIKRVLKHAWRIITPSEFTKNEIQKYYPRLAKDNIFVVPHGVDAKFCAQGASAFGGKVKEPYILYIGRVENKKNIVNLIKAFSILKNNYKLQVTSYKLLLIGPRGYGYEIIKKEITASPNKNDIHELGWLDREKVEEYLQSAALCVFPSLYEGFGLPILEAFASGTPVVASGIPAHKEVGGDAAHYFNPNDPKDIADKMRAMLENEKTRNDAIERGIIRAKFFSWQKASEKTFAILTEGVS